MTAIPERLGQVMAIDPAAPVLEFDGAWSTWGELGAAADAVDTVLAECGLGGGAPVGLMLRNRPAALGTLLGLLRAGACVVTVNPLLGAERLRSDLPTLGLPLLLGAADDLALVPADELPATARGAIGVLGAPIAVVPASVPPASTDASGVAVRMLTSGTTGPPKRIDLRYGMLDLVMRGAKHYETGTGSDVRLRSGVVIVNAPLVHVSGVFRVVQAMLDGRRIALLERFSVDGWVGAVLEHRPKTVSLVPTALRMVLDADVDDNVFTSIRSVISGTAPLDPDLAEAFTVRYRVPVLTSYGATEFGGGVAGWNLADHEEFAAAKRGSVGRAHAGCSLRIVDAESGTDLGTDAVGLLEVRAAQLGTDDWVRTTDLARLDTDGFLWIVGRADQTILRGGYKVQPEVVRAALERVPGVAEAAVVGVSDDRLGAVPVAAVERRPGVELDEASVLAAASAHLARYEVPVAVVVVDALPRTASGKADLAAVRALLADAAADTDVTSEKTEKWVFGEPPLPTVVELAGALRDLTSTVLALEQSSPELEALVQTVRDAQQQLTQQAPNDLRPRVGDHLSADQRVYVDHGYDVGAYNPCFPEYTLEVEGTGARGTVEFPIAYEGPPGIVHGGFLAVFFDCVLQQLNCELGLAGKTAELSLRFRRPTPLLTPLVYRAERTFEDNRIVLHAELFHGDDLTCEAHMRAAKGDHGASRGVAAPGMSAPTTVSRILRERATAQPDVEYVVCDDDRLTYAGAEQRSRVPRGGLLAAGAGRGSRVGLLFPTGIDFVLAWLAAVRVGAIAVPISTFSTSRELRDLFARADVDLVLGVAGYRGNDYVAAIEEAVGPFGDDARPTSAPFLRQVWLDGFADLEQRAAEVPDAVLDAVEDDITPDDRMILVHTSGSTSAPKGVIHQHGALLGHLDTLNGIRGLRAATRLFSNSPMFWIGGLSYNIIGVLVAGATLLCSAATDPVEALDFIERERPELTNGYAASIAALVAHPSFASRDFSSVRSGNLHPLLPAEIRPTDLELRHNMLGTTETGSVCLMSSDETDQPEHRRGSFGLPVPGLTPRVVDPETLEDVPTDTIGELWFRGPSLMEGYYGRERFEVFTPDGWYRTGDLFHVDADGFFYFHGRRGAMIKTAGANVSPLEVEAALSDATGGLVVMVLGVPDPERDQVVAAVILAEPDTAPDVEALRTELRTRLSAYKVPRRFLVLAPADLPMLSSGKPDLNAIAELFDD